MIERITEEYIKELLESSDCEITSLRNREVIVSYLLKSRGNFIISGYATVSDSQYFDFSKGVEIAKKDAIKKYWSYESFLHQCVKAGVIKSDIYD